MLLRSLPGLHYPITITKLFFNPNDEIRSSDSLFAYDFESNVREGREAEQVTKKFPAVFKSGYEGTLAAWRIEFGSVISGAGVPLAEITETCSHDVQYGGMCTLCGKDVTSIDYVKAVPDTRRAETNLAHTHSAFRISKPEATRIDQDTRLRLLRNRKLSLVVDLDLTVIHASVDPTIGEWQNDETNPNHDAVKDVRHFDMADNPLSARPSTYYIKLRPGLSQFFKTISEKYEMHVYTMGTRDYAEHVVDIIDDGRKFFGNRILSRTENAGNTQHKNLQKLFPVDDSMVVIIDDRADVWNWSSHLLQVKPFNFFVGIGDLNSSFLPKKEDLLGRGSASSDPQMRPPEGQTKAEEPTGPIPQSQTSDSRAQAPEAKVNGTSADQSTLNRIVVMQGSNDPGTLEQQTTEQNEDLAAQVLDRPLLQQQKQLEEAEAEASKHETKVPSVTEGTEDAQRARQGLLQDDDNELEAIQRELIAIHDEFYRAQEDKKGDVKDVSSSSGQSALTSVPDVREFVQRRRIYTLLGCRLLFTGVIPLKEDHYEHHMGKLARRLGAEIVFDVKSQPTHVIARPGDPTDKMKQATRFPHINIVTAEWLWQSSSQWWMKVDETPYLISIPRPGISSAVESSRTTAEPEDREQAQSELTLRLAGNDTIDRQAIDGDLIDSPISEINEDDWADAHKEIDELSSDDDDEQEDDDDDVDQVEVDENGESQETEIAVAGKKRKREPEDEGDRDEDEDDDGFGAAMAAAVQARDEENASG